MSRRGPRRMAELLGTDNLSSLSAEAESRRALAARVRSALAEPEASHVVAAHVDDDGKLVVSMESGAWAARIRYTTPELLGYRVSVRVAAPGRDRPA